MFLHSFDLVPPYVRMSPHLLATICEAQNGDTKHSGKFNSGNQLWMQQVRMTAVQKLSKMAKIAFFRRFRCVGYVWWVSTRKMCQKSAQSICSLYSLCHVQSTLSNEQSA